MPPPADAIQKKVCMVGSYSVGKTSLVRRYVESIFSDHYLTNIGVKIDKKLVKVDGRTVNLVLWDLAGEDEISQMRPSHLRGASGYILVVDGCRGITLEKALQLRQRIQELLGDIPFVAALNKIDLLPEWEVSESSIENLRQQNWRCFLTSAKTGQTVENLFTALATEMLACQK